MKRYSVVLNRSFTVIVDAENPEKASRIVESFIGYDDDATDEDRIQNKFNILAIDMLENDAIEVNLIE